MEIEPTYVDWVTEARMAELTGLTQRALQNKRFNKVHPEGLVWARIDGRVMYCISGYNQWCHSQRPGYQPAPEGLRAPEAPQPRVRARQEDGKPAPRRRSRISNPGDWKLT